ICLNTTNINYDKLGYYLEQTPNFTTTGYKFSEYGYLLVTPDDINYAINGTGYNDYILINKQNNIIFTNGGNDIIDIESTSGKNYIYGISDSYNDTCCILNGLNSYTELQRMRKCNIQIKGIKSSELNLFFNVVKDQYGDTSSECIILDDKHKSSILKGVANLSTGIHTDNIDAILSIQEVSSSGQFIKEITSSNWKYLKHDLEKEIFDYLKDRPYTSAFELFNKGTSQHKQELYNIYQKWFNYYNKECGFVSECTSGEYKGTDKKDIFYINNKMDRYNNTIECYGYGGNDEYKAMLSNYASPSNKVTITISDNSGEHDVLNLGNESSLLKFKFDVILNSSNDSSNFTIGNDLKLYTGNEKSSDIITIKDYFNNGKIEEITTGDNKILSDNYLNTIAQEIANWLANNNYSSTYEVFESNDTNYINNFVAIYTANQSQIWIDK
ncbi:MAG: hypothetical protein NC200_02555, partial [Candidatus Gastranaerophilales bacterium]|nr:hypothetical protein [Candidatus Gastranaerophilales bacterium]